MVKIKAANSPIQNIDTDGETDTYYILVVDAKTGKSAFQTVILENNYPDKNHFVIHFKDKDGSVKKVTVNEKTFSKVRLDIINKATLFDTKKLNKVEKSLTGDEGSPEYIPDDESNSNANDGTSSFLTELLKAMGIGNATVMEGEDKTPIKGSEADLEKSSSSSTTKTKPEEFDAVLENKSSGKLDTIPTILQDTSASREAMESKGSVKVKEFIKK